MGRMTMTIGSIDIEVRSGGEVVRREVRGFTIDSDDAARAIACPSCGAGKGNDCYVRSGPGKGQRRAPHEARRKAAARQGVAAPMRPLGDVDVPTGLNALFEDDADPGQEME